MKLNQKIEKLKNNLEEVSNIFNNQEINSIFTSEKTFTYESIQQTIKGIEKMDFNLKMLVDDDGGFDFLIKITDLIMIGFQSWVADFSYLDDENLSEFAIDCLAEDLEIGIKKEDVALYDSIEFIN